MKFTRTVSPRPPLPVNVQQYSRLTLQTESKKAWLDDKKQPLKLGRWMFYLPREQVKCFHARLGMTDCTSAARPSDKETIADDTPVGRYTMADWRRALNTPIHRRLAEVWLVSARLWRAGLGPQPLGIVFIDSFSRDGEELGPTCGLRSQNVGKLPRKLDCRIEHIEAAGVVPDRILSCVRQQRRGYVIDLCSVIGCQPVDAEATVAQLATELSDGKDHQRLIHLLEQTLPS